MYFYLSGNSTEPNQKHQGKAESKNKESRPHLTLAKPLDPLLLHKPFNPRERLASNFSMSEHSRENMYTDVGVWRVQLCFYSH